MISLLRPGNSVIHRMSVGPKLLLLIALIALISVGGANPIFGGAALALTAFAYWVSFPKAFVFAEQFWGLKYLLLLVVVPQILFGANWQIVLTNALRFTDAILLASLFTLTTRVDELLGVIEKGFKPMARLGIKPETVSLTLVMTINAIPMISMFLQQTKEAQQARGVKPKATLLTVPLLVASLKYADEFAEALTARGVEV
jgi:biotin transport system permease protein